MELDPHETKQRDQQYDYDELNRLKRVHEYTGNAALDWQQEYLYDRWGNRRIDTNATKTFGTGINNKDFSVEDATNRLYAPGDLALQDTQRRIRYDAMGNQTTDIYTGYGTASFDAENHITSIQNNTGGTSTYTYNADGQRTRRKTGTQETWQIYGMDGELLAEYPQAGDVHAPQKEYGYRNGQLLITAEPGGASAAPAFSDNFDDNSLNASVYYPGVAPTVSEQSQQLQITLSPNTAAYNGVYSNSLYDLTNRMVQIESVQAVSQAGWCENFLEVELNANNYFMIQVGAGNMLFRARVNGVNDQTSIPFDGTANRFWRLRHDQSANQVYFETSANGTVWLTRKTVTPGFALTALRFHLLAGAYGSGNSSPGTAKYDNFKLLASLAPTSLTVPNAGFETLVLGNGNFQYSPSGGSWTFADGGGITGMNSAFTGSPSTAPEGVQVAFIQSTGTVSQSISGFQANADYVITFSAIQRTNCCNGSGQDIGVYIDNTQVASFHPSAIAYTEYSTLTFSTTAGPHTVKFVGLNPVAGGVTAFLDKVRITGNPKPGFGVQWLVTDHLGTPRLILDQTGSLANIKRHDYLPFGEELFAGTGARTTALGYTGSDGVRQHFTLKERDVETGLDYFGARYYGSTQGRFTSPDPLLSSGKSLQPQSWNRYSYCLNDPLKYVDPNGLIWQMQTTVKDNVSTTTYKWVWQDDPEEGWERVTDFHPDVVGPDGRTVGSRAVGNAEFEQLMRTGTFEAGPNALGGKWFWESAESAQKFGLWAEGKGAFKIVDAKIPTVQADRFMRLENLDGIGPARYAELPELKNATIGKKP